MKRKENNGKKKGIKMILKILLGLLGAFVICLLAIFFRNRIMLAKEKTVFENPLGEMVEVDGNKMCVYTTGEGEHTLLFLSGSGTVSPILDFKSLYDLMKDDYRIVVIEKFGYGFSDIVETERSFDTILRQDREALSKLGMEGPYILCPHSMSALEAIYWAQEYPEEVQAIIGLDMAVPKVYDEMNLAGTLKEEKLLAVFREMGIVRLYYSDSMIPGNLTKEEKRIYRAIGSKIAVNDCVYNEGVAIPDVCQKISKKQKPDVPTLLFVSNGKGLGVKDWTGLQKDYANGLSHAEIVELSCGHYVHDFEYELISKKMREFLQNY
jgi:pimeloyl-ACP methyl ester carboxylesterase